MLPYITIFGRSIGANAIMVLCGIFASGTYASFVARKRGYDYTEIIIFMLLVSIGVIVGGHLMYAIVTVANNRNIMPSVIANINADNFLSIIFSIFGGSVFYGGLIGGLIAGRICIMKHDTYSNYIDIVAVSVPLFHFFGRIGCFLGGCCFGIESSFGFPFHDSPVTEANGIARFPVQLLEAFFSLGLFFLLRHLMQNQKIKNKLIYAYLLSYSTGRFFIEFLRGDDHRGIWVFLSTSQIISIMIFLFALIKCLSLKSHSLCGKR